MSLKIVLIMNFIANTMCEKLNETKLKRLGEHRYSSSGSTFLDPIMQRFWNWFVIKLPLWWAPNCMTLIGLASNIITALILVYYSPDAKQEIPSWALLFCALGLFIYQTLDACDGKQARRTNSSSPLGELFDHGCDAVSTIFVSLSVCLSTQLGTNINTMLLLCVFATALFYMAHWQTYVSGTLKFGRFDVTEAQFTIIAILIISAIFGTNVWNYEIMRIKHVLIELKSIPMFFSIANEARILFCQLFQILKGGVGKNGSTVAGTSILSPFLPIFLAVVFPLTIFHKSQSLIFENHLSLYIITFGLVTAKITNKLVVAHMSKSEISKLDSVFIGPLLLFLNQYFNTFLNEYMLLWVALVYTLVDFLYYSYSTCSQIADYLNIMILSTSHQRLKNTNQTSLRNNSTERSTNDVKEYVSLLMDQYLEDDNNQDINVLYDKKCLNQNI